MHPVFKLKSTLDRSVSGLLLSAPAGCLEGTEAPLSS